MEMLFLLEQLLVICNALISYKIVLGGPVAQPSNRYFLAVMLQLLATP